ncbi:ferritin-like domain-containing protein [Kitasatospora sp. McL0602]|uniref:ferritin-like domain-containing protein n=1 Tax=Kitasatospora sp. McL0602 TaxID=3439530 RepID=UPI003F8C469A
MGELPGAPVLPPEFNWRDYTVMLLHVAAEIEHSLMVQYLYAAYSLGGPQVPEAHRESVRRWQETILGIAKEEMGHLLTVQNLLTALGAPVNLDREDYPWGTEFYPFPFTLRRLTLASLATYVCAESPPGWAGAEADAIKELAGCAAGQPVNQVGALYRRLTAVLADKERTPDVAFQAATLPYQASWDEWGRGYTRGERGQESGNVPDTKSAELLIRGVHSRDSAVKALHDIGEQGEAFEEVSPDGDGDAGETSHFRRFLSIFQEITALPEGDRELISRPVADNPRTAHRLNEETAALAAGVGRQTTREITDPVTAGWGHLFNLRYRMLLVDIAHAFRLSGPLDDGTVLTARGSLIHRAFAEMYNLRAISGMLVQLPLSASEPDGDRAGPPFEMPYTLELPDQDRNRWLLQRDLLQASQLAVAAVRRAPGAVSGAVPYLVALAESDRISLQHVERILDAHGLGSPNGSPNGRAHGQLSGHVDGRAARAVTDLSPPLTDLERA